MRPARFLPIVLLAVAVFCLIGVYASPNLLAGPTRQEPSAPATGQATASQAAPDAVSALPATASPSAAATVTSLPPSPTFTATPPPTPTPSASFAVIGDYGLAGQAEADVAALVKSWGPEFIITTGDNNYPNGESATIDQNIGQYYQEFIASYAGDFGPGSETNRFFPTLGNHDLYSEWGEPYFDYFNLPGNERYYDFQWGPVHFFALNGDPGEPDGFRADSVQGTWLQAGLAGSTAPWQIVYFHQAPYSSGTHGSSVWMQWPFAAWGADAVISTIGPYYKYGETVVKAAIEARCNLVDVCDDGEDTNTMGLLYQATYARYSHTWQ